MTLPALPLRARRHALGLTQASVASSAGISIPALRNLETGRGAIGSLARMLPVLELRWSWVEGAAFGPALTERRRAAGLSQSALAMRVGCSRPTTHALEHNLTGRLETLLRVLGVLDLRTAVRELPRASKPGLVPLRNAPERDRVMTPPALAAAIIAHFADRISGHMLDPARGAGAFYDQLPEHLDRSWCELEDGRDFLDWEAAVDWIITPPLVEDPSVYAARNDGGRSYRLAGADREHHDQGPAAGSSGPWLRDRGAGADRRDLHPLVQFALMTGTRQGSICQLRWRDIDVDTGRMKFKMKTDTGTSAKSMNFPIS